MNSTTRITLLSDHLVCLHIGYIEKSRPQDGGHRIWSSPLVRNRPRAIQREHAAPPTLKVYLFSYLDDINPLVVSRTTTKSFYNEGVRRVLHVLHQETEQSGLTFDREKVESLDFSNGVPGVTLGAQTRHKPIKQLGI